MGIYFKIKTAFAAPNRSIFISFIKSLAAKLTENASLVSNLKVSGATFLTNIHKVETLTTQAKSNDKTSSAQVKILIEQIKNDFREDAYCVEAAVNDAQDITIATILGFEIKQARGKEKGPGLKVTNAITVGNLKIKTGKVKKYHYYIIECTQKFFDGSPDIITEKTMPDPSSEVKGFISGALYLIRVRVVLARNVMGKWSDYVLIRVN